MAFKLPEDTATRPIAIVGAGTLGRRMVLMLATRGAEARRYDPDAAVREAGVAFAPEQLPRVLETIQDGKAGAIVGCDDLEAALQDAWHVVEAVPEKLELKKAVFRQIDALSAPDAILASNSSSYPSSAFADSVTNPARLLNTHYLMPPRATPVELMSCGHTDPAVIRLMADVLPGYGLTPYISCNARAWASPTTASGPPSSARRWRWWPKAWLPRRSWTRSTPRPPARRAALAAAWMPWGGTWC